MSNRSGGRRASKAEARRPSIPLARDLRRLAAVALLAGALALWVADTAGHAHTAVHAHPGGHAGPLHAASHLVGAGLPGWEVAHALARWATYSAVLLAAGGTLFLTAIHDRLPGERRLLAGVVTGAAVAGALGTIAVTFLHAGQASGLGAAVVREPAVLGALLAAPDGASAIARVVALAVLLAGVPASRVARGDGVRLLGGTVAVLSFALAGHAVTAQPRWVVLVADACHTVAASMWFGGLVLLGLVLHRREGSGDPAPSALMVARFSTWAIGSVALVVAGGLVLAWAEVRTLDALLSSPYGWTLTVKVAFVAAVAGVGGYNNRVLVPAIRRTAPEAAETAWRRLRWTVRAEIAGLAVVLAATAVLVDRSPPRPHLDTPPAGGGTEEAETVPEVAP